MAEARYTGPAPTKEKQYNDKMYYVFQTSCNETELLAVVNDWCFNHFGGFKTAAEMPWMMMFDGSVLIHEEDDAFEFRMRWC